MAGHVFQTEGLGAELYFVMDMAAPAAVLVFDGVRNGAVVLDDIGLANQAETVGPDGEGTLDLDALADVGVGDIDLFVGMLSAKGVEVFVPNLVEVDEGALARAVRPVLQCGDEDQIGVVKRWEAWVRHESRPSGSKSNARRKPWCGVKPRAGCQGRVN